MRRCYVTPKIVLKLAKEFWIEYEKKNPPAVRRGRKEKFPKYYILALSILQEKEHYSYREILIFSSIEGIIPKELKNKKTRKIPVLSNYWYRVKTLDKKIIEEFIKYLGLKLVKNSNKKYIYGICDGTGFSYNDLYPMRYYRGEEIKYIKNHVRVVPFTLLSEEGRDCVLIGIKSGKAYSSELKMAKDIYRGLSYKGFKYFIGDKQFDNIELLEMLERDGKEAVIDIKVGLWNGVRDERRKRSLERVKSLGIYKYRTREEGLFGNVKNKTGRHINVKDEEIARKFAMIKFAIYNIYLISKAVIKNYYLLFIFIRILEHRQIIFHLTKNLKKIFLIFYGD